jgi:hypothetical protein
MTLASLCTDDEATTSDVTNETSSQADVGATSPCVQSETSTYQDLVKKHHLKDLTVRIVRLASKPSTHSTTSQPSTHSTTSQPSTHNTTNKPSTHNTTNKPSTHSTTNKPSTHSTTIKPSTHNTTNKPSTHNTTNKPSTHSTTNKPSTHSTTNKPSTHSTTSKPAAGHVTYNRKLYFLSLTLKDKNKALAYNNDPGSFDVTKLEEEHQAIKYM